MNRNHATKEELKSLIGRSFPSEKHTCWIVNEISDTLDGRYRLLSADMKFESRGWTRELVEKFQELDKEIKKEATP